MLPDPLHPAVVHFPIALAALMPLIAIAMLVAGVRGWLPEKRAWVIATVGTLAVVATAIRTGEEGGALVYEHGAVSAYQTGGAAAPAAATVSDEDGRGRGRGRGGEEDED